MAEDMLQFLQEFREAHKSYFTAPLFITGESYGGVYLASAGSANCNPVRSSVIPRGMAVSATEQFADMQCAFCACTQATMSQR